MLLAWYPWYEAMRRAPLDKGHGTATSRHAPIPLRTAPAFCGKFYLELVLKFVLAICAARMALSTIGQQHRSIYFV